MGHEKLNIISMNSSRLGHQNLSQNGRRGYLGQVLEDAKPDLCLLPGDIDDLRKNVVIGYEQFMTETDHQTVLLYDADKLCLRMPEPSLTSLGEFRGIDFGQIVCPKVEVMSLQPNASVVKEFSIVTWNYQMCSSSMVDRHTQAEDIITMSQRLAMSRAIPVLICGDFNLNLKSLRAIVNKLSKDEQHQLMMNVQNGFSSYGYTPSMANGTMRPIRHLVKMDVYSCNKPGLNTYAGYHPSDYFVASKGLDLQQATMLDFSSATGRQIQLHPALKEHRPTQTHMEIPVRPPRHHGG